MKELINSPDGVIVEVLRGIDAANENVRVDHENHVIFRAEPTRAREVAMVSGGGSGHELSHGSFVGVGMLDAACTDQVFISPTPDQMLVATVGTDVGAGVLRVVKNYTDDVMSFEMAAELAAEQGVCIETMVVADDVAVEDSLCTAGRRGVGLTMLLEKIIGTAAEESRNLGAVITVTNKVNENGRSTGMALTSCTAPVAGKPTFDLLEDQMEVGIGIHGEPDRHRGPLTGARDITHQLAEPILTGHNFVGSETIVMVNGMGGTPLTELYLMYGEAKALLDAARVRVARNLVGNYITSLDMTGRSVTILKADNELLALWDAPIRAARLRWGP